MTELAGLILKGVVPSISLSAIEREIAILDHLIETTEDEISKRVLAIAFQTLNWARNPTAFAPPSDMKNIWKEIDD